MKKMRLHILILIGVFLITFIIGSFLDLNISQSIASSSNNFAILMSHIGLIPGYGVLAFIGGGFLFLGIKKYEKVWVKIIFILAAIAFVGVPIFYIGREFFGANGFEGKAPKWIGYLISTPVVAGITVLGYFITTKCKNDKIWIVFVLVGVISALALIGGTTVLKSIFHRPRYRAVYAYGIDFYPWYQRCTNYKELTQILNIKSEEFKSFPSGHACGAALFIVGVTFLPLMNEEYEKFHLPLFYFAALWLVLVSISRIMAAAHYLSDVSMGSLIMLIFLFIGNEILINTKLIKKKEEVTDNSK